MNNANHRCEVQRLLEDWSQNERQARSLINCLVEFLFDDTRWLHENISETDKKTLFAVTRRLFSETAGEGEGE
jgi:hypothetical protein